MTSLRIDAVAPGDEIALRAFWETERAAHRADRPYAVLAPLSHQRLSISSASRYYRRVLLLGSLDGQPVGTAHVGISLKDNQHLGDLEVAVLPEHRRRGHGRRLYEAGLGRLAAEGRDTVVGEAHTPLDPHGSAPWEFALAMGCEDVHQEDHLVLELPRADADLAELRTRLATASYDVLTWRDRCPDEHVAAYCALASQMSSDVPLGGVDYQPVTFDEARLRLGEERAGQSYDSVVAAARERASGALVAYSVVYLPHDGEDAIQDDTLVMPDHRGHRLGTLLKLATLEAVQREHPGRRLLHTWTSPDNPAMHHTNLGFGYRPVERLHEMQRRI